MTSEEVLKLIDKHVARCREEVSRCPKWSPAQAEWSRARDALLNLRDDVATAIPQYEDTNHD